MFGLAEGPVQGIGEVFSGQSVTPFPTNFLSLIPGDTPQRPWGPALARYPAAALPYNGTAYLASPYFDLGSSATISSIAFEVVGRLAGTAGPLGQDADPAELISDFLTNAQYGVGLPASALSGAALFGASGDASYQTYCAALGLGLSPALTDAETANAILARWLRLTNSAAVWSGARLRIVPYGDQVVTGVTHSGASVTYVPDVAPVYDLTDDDVLAAEGDDPVRVARSDPYGLPNVQRVECSDRSHGYTATTVEARDQGAIERYGLKVGGTITAREICALSIGRLVAQLALQRALYIRNTYTFRLSWEFCLLEPMDVVTLTDPGLGLARTPVRITAIEEDEDGLLTITAEEFPRGTATAGALPGGRRDWIGGRPRPGARAGQRSTDLRAARRADGRRAAGLDRGLGRQRRPVLGRGQRLGLARWRQLRRDRHDHGPGAPGRARRGSGRAGRAQPRPRQHARGRSWPIRRHARLRR